TPPRQDLQLAAIQAIAERRFDDAIVIVGPLREHDAAAPAHGRCRNCGSTEHAACALLDPTRAGATLEGVLVTCQWVDHEQTVCSNKRCVERWLRDDPGVAEPVLAGPGGRRAGEGLVLP